MKTENTTDFKEVNEDSNVLSKKSLFDNFNVIVPKEYDFIIRKSTYAGYYRVGGNTGNVNFSLGKKPIWLHRKLMKLCLGWKWIDNKKL